LQAQQNAIHVLPIDGVAAPAHAPPKPPLQTTVTSRDAASEESSSSRHAARARNI
jgi:hypothetical protein